MSSADVTRRELSFGSQDSTTGWYALNYALSTIKGSMQPQGAALMGLPCGSYSKYPHTFFTEYLVHEGDQIEFPIGSLNYYTLNTVTEWWCLDKFSHRVCEAVKQQFPLRDDTSGTWHLDSDLLTTDSRSRHKVYLDGYLSLPGIDYITCFDGADYPIKYLFNDDLGVDTDLVISIGKEPATALTDYNHSTYAFVESVPINIYAVNKTGLTATNLVEQAEQEIRHIITDHPLGSIRSIQTIKHTPIDLGNCNYLWNTTITIKYTRANDDYVPTLPSLTWGPSASPTGTFIFPNCTKITLPNANNDIFTKIPGRIGERLQRLGAKSLEIQLTCNLDMEHSDLSWKRPQTTTPKTDAVNFQVFLDIMHNALSEEYQTLTLDWGSFQVRLTDMQPNLDGDENSITLTFKEYVSANAASLTYQQRFGIA
jgi:hypothetical protein